MLKLDTRKILVPMDFSDTAMYAIRHACFLAQYTKGEVLLLHVISKSHEVYNVIQPELHVDVNMKELGTALEKKLETMAEELRHEYGISIQTEVITGNVAIEIVKTAEETKCGLIIMGTQGYSALEMIFIGSITMKVLGASKIPVMSVRTPAGKHGYKNIVLPIDSSQHSRQKVNIAIELCHDFGAHLHVGHDR
jgi:nucleotide-binding universal stress UspA family protein